MIFDQFCGLVERHMPEAVALLKRAHLFEFEGDPIAVLPKKFDRDQATLLQETFFLPFPVIVMEDRVSCVLLFDRGQDQQGLSGPRYFMECQPLDYAHLQYCRDADAVDQSVMKKLSELPPGLAQISVGKIESMKMNDGSDTKTLIEGHIDRFLTCDRRKIYDSGSGLPQSVVQALTTAVLSNVTFALEEVFYFNTPNRFVVERSPATSVRPNPNVQIPRSDHRPRYILLTPAEIQARLGFGSHESAATEGRTAPTPHHRRRHYRQLKSDRYKKARGKLLCIPATWVGPDEGVHQKVRYKVRLDL